MKQILVLLLLIINFQNCRYTKSETKINTETDKKFSTKSYLDIQLDSNGHLPSNPYIVEFKNGTKQIVFCGVEHLTDNNDTTNSMFQAIERKFFDERPNIAINEGGDVSKRIYFSRQDAILKDGEIGLIKLLCDSLKIKTIDGDPAFDVELKALLKKYSKGEVLAYIVTERLMWGLKGQQITDTEIIENNFNQFIQNYFIKKGATTLNETEQQFTFYKTNYKKITGRPFDMADLKPTNPFDPIGKFQEIGRSSKEIRDQFLLKRIDAILDSYDKVFVVFGGWHLLTCEPGLKEIIYRNRK